MSISVVREGRRKCGVYRRTDRGEGKEGKMKDGRDKRDKSELVKEVKNG